MTTFWRAKHLNIPTYSIALSQPEGFEYPELEFFKPILDGVWLNSKSKTFKQDYELVLSKHATEIGPWIDSLNIDQALVCWCKSQPYKLSRCHRILVGNLIKRMRPDIEISMDLNDPAWRK